MNIEDILAMEPCEDSLEFLKSCKSFAEAWINCDRGDWMLWLVGMLPSECGSDARKKLKKLLDLIVDDTADTADTADIIACYERAKAADAANHICSAHTAAVASYATEVAEAASVASAAAGYISTFCAKKSEKLKQYAELVREHYTIDEIHELFGRGKK